MNRALQNADNSCIFCHTPPATEATTEQFRRFWNHWCFPRRARSFTSVTVDYFGRALETRTPATRDRILANVLNSIRFSPQCIFNNQNYQQLLIELVAEYRRTNGFNITVLPESSISSIYYSHSGSEESSGSNTIRTAESHNSQEEVSETRNENETIEATSIYQEVLSFQQNQQEDINNSNIASGSNINYINNNQQDNRDQQQNNNQDNNSQHEEEEELELEENNQENNKEEEQEVNLLEQEDSDNESEGSGRISLRTHRTNRPPSPINLTFRPFNHPYNILFNTDTNNIPPPPPYNNQRMNNNNNNNNGEDKDVRQMRETITAFQNTLQAIGTALTTNGGGGERRMVDFPIFEGESQDPVEWIEKFQIACVANRVADNRILTIVPAYLKGPALT